jgi:hypothetical protein
VIFMILTRIRRHKSPIQRNRRRTASPSVCDYDKTHKPATILAVPKPRVYSRKSILPNLPLASTKVPPCKRIERTAVADLPADTRRGPHGLGSWPGFLFCSYCSYRVAPRIRPPQTPTWRLCRSSAQFLRNQTCQLQSHPQTKSHLSNKSLPRAKSHPRAKLSLPRTENLTRKHWWSKSTAFKTYLADAAWPSTRTQRASTNRNLHGPNKRSICPTKGQ